MGNPLGLREYLAYATAGGAVLIAVLIAWTGDATPPSPSALGLALALLAAYMFGHVLAEFGTRVIGRVMRAEFGAMMSVLLGAPVKDEASVASKVLGPVVRRLGRSGGDAPDKPLPLPLLNRVVQAGERRGIRATDKQGPVALQFQAEAVVNISPGTERADRAGMMEDFSRNACIGFAVGVPLLLAGAVRYGHAGLFSLAMGYALASVAMCIRYMHFRRRYFVIVLAQFAELTLGVEAAETSTGQPSG